MACGDAAHVALRSEIDAPGAGALAAALDARLRTSPLAPPLAGRQATVVLAPTTDGPAVSIELRRGQRPRMRRARALRPTTVVRGPAAVLLAIAEGRRDGVEAFLRGAVTVRGDLSLALALDGLFDPAPGRPSRWPRSRVAQPLGVRTALLDAGPTGPTTAAPVVAVHGLGATNASVLPLVWDLAADRRVLAPDLPGFGASAAPRCPYTAAWYARWLIALLDEHELDRVVVLGNSLGGRIALELGLLAPERVAALVLLAPSPALRRWRQWVPLARLARPELAALPLRTFHRLVVTGIRALFADPDRLPAPWYDAAADEFLRVMRSGNHRVAFFACLRRIYLEPAFGPAGFWERLPALSPPSLFVWGGRDRLVPVGYARHVHAALPHAASVVLPDCGHVPQFEHPEATAALVREFLAALPVLSPPGGPRGDHGAPVEV